jgi:hypothetical protein
MNRDDIVKEIDDILSTIRSKAYALEQTKQIRLDLSVLLTMLSDEIGDVHEQQGRAEYERKRFMAERTIGYRRGEFGKKETSGDAEALSTIDAEDYYNEEYSWKGMYRKLENKRQALLQVCNSLSAFGRDMDNDSI